MSEKIQFQHALEESQRAFQSVIDQQSLVESVLEAIVESTQSGGKVFWLGNGGSAADAQHMAAELMVRYVKNRAPIASIALTTDTSIITAHTNDYDFSTVFSRQLEGLAKQGDVVIAMTTSGTSSNVVQAVKKAKELGCVAVALIGQDSGEIASIADYCLRINSKQTARVQEAHSFFSHLLCEGLDSISQ